MELNILQWGKEELGQNIEVYFFHLSLPEDHR